VSDTRKVRVLPIAGRPRDFFSMFLSMRKVYAGIYFCQ
jgi:hypothetical protein